MPFVMSPISPAETLQFEKLLNSKKDVEVLFYSKLLCDSN